MFVSSFGIISFPEPLIAPLFSQSSTILLLYKIPQIPPRLTKVSVSEFTFPWFFEFDNLAASPFFPTNPPKFTVLHITPTTLDTCPSFRHCVIVPLLSPAIPPILVLPITFPVFLEFSIVAVSNIATIPPANSSSFEFSFKLLISAVFWQATMYPVDFPTIPPTIFPSIFPLLVQLVMFPFWLSATIPAV